MDKFFEIVKYRVAAFKKVVESQSDISKDILREMNLILNELRKRIESEMCAWYSEYVLRKDIPSDLAVFVNDFDLPENVTNVFKKQRCAVCGDRRVLNIAHIKPRHLNGSDNIDNLLRLCANHHFMFEW